MARQLRIDDPDLARQAQGADVIIIGSRRFVLVDDVTTAPADGQPYEPTPEEVEMLREAAADTRPRLSGKDVDAYLSRGRRELGLDR